MSHPTPPASPPRPKMLGTVLPQDSMRGLRGPWNELEPSAHPLPPPPPSVASSAASSIAYQENLKLLAAAGRDLFRRGLAFDGVRPTKQEARHPAVTPNLLSIPEDNSVSASDVSAPSELVVIVGGPLNSRGEPGLWVSNRIAKAIQLYWQTMLSFAHDDGDDEDDEASRPKALCFLVPTGGESADEGVVETEAIRNALVGTGISPHHIIMDCTATNLVDNAIQLVSIVQHLHVSKVHIVTSAFQVARARLCYDEVFRVLGGDLSGVKVFYHGAPDGLKPAERSERQMIEQTLIQNAHNDLDVALKRLSSHKQSKSSKRSSQGLDNARTSQKPTV